MIVQVWRPALRLSHNNNKQIREKHEVGCPAGGTGQGTNIVSLFNSGTYHECFLRFRPLQPQLSHSSLIFSDFAELVELYVMIDSLGYNTNKTKTPYTVLSRSSFISVQ